MVHAPYHGSQDALVWLWGPASSLAPTSSNCSSAASFSSLKMSCSLGLRTFKHAVPFAWNILLFLKHSSLPYPIPWLISHSPFRSWLGITVFVPVSFPQHCAFFTLIALSYSFIHLKIFIKNILLPSIVLGSGNTIAWNSLPLWNLHSLFAPVWTLSYMGALWMCLFVHSLHSGAFVSIQHKTWNYFGWKALYTMTNRWC